MFKMVEKFKIFLGQELTYSKLSTCNKTSKCNLYQNFTNPRSFQTINLVLR